MPSMFNETVWVCYDCKTVRNFFTFFIASLLLRLSLIVIHAKSCMGCCVSVQTSSAGVESPSLISVLLTSFGLLLFG